MRWRSSTLTDSGLSLHLVLLQAHEMPLAEPYEGSLTRFQKLLVLRCLRPDRVLAGVRDFVCANLGQRFIEPPSFDLAACFKESSPSTPLVFVLSPGKAAAGAAVKCCSVPLMVSTHSGSCWLCVPTTSLHHQLLVGLKPKNGCVAPAVGPRLPHST